MHQARSQAEYDFIRDIVIDKHPAVKLYQAAIALGDIPNHKLQYYGPPVPFESIEAWLTWLEQFSDVE